MTETAKRWECKCGACKFGTWYMGEGYGPPEASRGRTCHWAYHGRRAGEFCPDCPTRLNADGTITVMAPAWNQGADPWCTLRMVDIAHRTSPEWRAQLLTETTPDGTADVLRAVAKSGDSIDAAWLQKAACLIEQFTAMQPAGSPSVEWVLDRCAGFKAANDDRTDELRRTGGPEYQIASAIGLSVGVGAIHDAIPYYRAEHPAPAPEHVAEFAAAHALLTRMIDAEKVDARRARENGDAARAEIHCQRKEVLWQAREWLKRETLPASDLIQQGFRSVVEVAEEMTGRSRLAIEHRVADKLGIDDQVLDHLMRGAAPAPQWSADWPTEPGWYWYFGRVPNVHPRPTLLPVHLIPMTGERIPIAWCGNWPIHKDDDRGYWFLPATVPDPPQPAPAAREDGDRGGQRC